MIHRPLWLIVVAASLVVACRPGTTANSAHGTTKGTIGVSVLTLGNPFFRVIGDNLTAELDKSGYKAIVVAGEFDVAKQQQQVRDFIVAKCAAIVLCPCNSKGIG